MSGHISLSCALSLLLEGAILPILEDVVSGEKRVLYIADRSTCLHVPLTVLACAGGLCCLLCQWLAVTEETHYKFLPAMHDLTLTLSLSQQP